MQGIAIDQSTNPVDHQVLREQRPPAPLLQEVIDLTMEDSLQTTEEQAMPCSLSLGLSSDHDGDGPGDVAASSQQVQAEGTEEDEQAQESSEEEDLDEEDNEKELPLLYDENHRVDAIKSAQKAADKHHSVWTITDAGFIERCGLPASFISSNIGLNIPVTIGELLLNLKFDHLKDTQFKDGILVRIVFKENTSNEQWFDGTVYVKAGLAYRYWSFKLESGFKPSLNLDENSTLGFRYHSRLPNGVIAIEVTTNYVENNNKDLTETDSDDGSGIEPQAEEEEKVVSGVPLSRFKVIYDENHRTEAIKSAQEKCAASTVWSITDDGFAQRCGLPASFIKGASNGLALNQYVGDVVFNAKNMVNHEVPLRVVYKLNTEDEQWFDGTVTHFKYVPKYSFLAKITSKYWLKVEDLVEDLNLDEDSFIGFRYHSRDDDGMIVIEVTTDYVEMWKDVVLGTPQRQNQQGDDDAYGEEEEEQSKPTSTDSIPLQTTLMAELIKETRLNLKGKVWTIDDYGVLTKTITTSEMKASTIFIGKSITQMILAIGKQDGKKLGPFVGQSMYQLPTEIICQIKGQPRKTWKGHFSYYNHEYSPSQAGCLRFSAMFEDLKLTSGDIVRFRAVPYNNDSEENVLHIAVLQVTKAADGGREQHPPAPKKQESTPAPAVDASQQVVQTEEKVSLLMKRPADSLNRTSQAFASMYTGGGKKVKPNNTHTPVLTVQRPLDGGSVGGSYHSGANAEDTHLDQQQQQQQQQPPEGTAANVTSKFEMLIQLQDIFTRRQLSTKVWNSLDTAFMNGNVRFCQYVFGAVQRLDADNGVTNDVFEEKIEMFAQQLAAS